uniref:CdaR family protein n=1 Tax=Agathobacter sp. TaxID=2021311 RepID=UPI0040563755
MRKKILKALTNNLGFKILAVIFAFTLWLMVYNTDDPSITRYYTVNVNVLNGDYLEELNKYYEVIDGTNKVTFSATAKRSILDKMEESDFTATANMENISIDDAGVRGTVPVEIVCNKNSSSIKLSANNKYYKVVLEDLMSKPFVITPSTVGTVAEGYALGDVKVTVPNMLKISGPASIVQTISKVVATIDVNGMYLDLTDNVVPVLLDANGEEIDTTRLTLSNGIVTISAQILKTKELPITIKTTGTPAANHVVTSVSSNPTTLLVKGSISVLNGMNAIEIPESVISVANANEDINTTIEVSEYLPEGVELVNGRHNSVEVNVRIEPVKTKTFSVSTANIQVTGLLNEDELTFVHSSVAASVSGQEDDINQLEDSEIKGNIDVTDLEPGTHQVELHLDLDETKYQYSPITVSVIIADKNADSETGEP